MVDPQQKLHSFWQSPPGIAVTFALVGIAWIVGTDFALGWVSEEPEQFAKYQTLKGIIFIAGVAGFLYLLNHRFLSRVDAVMDAVRQLDERCQLIARNFPGGAILFFDKDQHCLSCDGAILQDFQWAPEAVVGKKLTDIFEQRDWEVAGFPNSLLLSHGESFHSEFSRKNRHYETWIVPVRNSDNPNHGGMLFILDVTERKRSEEELIESKEIMRDALHQAEAASRAKDDFLAVMSHEMRTPLNPIMGYTELLLQDERPQEEKDYLNEIITASQKLLRLIDDVLYYTKLNRDQWKLNPATFNLYEFAVSLVDEYRSEAGTVKMDLEWADTQEAALSKNLSVRCDAFLLRKILENFLNNACKYTNEGSITLKVRCDSRHDNVGRFTFAVCDTGLGIDPEAQSNIFEIFTQADSSINRQHEGVGLGLSICKKLALILDGKIGVESQPGEGSTFWLSVELEITENLPNPAAKESSQNEPLRIGKPATILVVEDRMSNALYAETVLSKAGASTIVAENGRIALEDCTSKRFDLILMDLSMPELDGFETTRRIRQENGPNRQTPIVALTASCSKATENKCREYGMQGFIPKPVKMSSLVDEVRRHLKKP